MDSAFGGQRMFHLKKETTKEKNMNNMNDRIATKAHATAYYSVSHITDSELNEN